MNNFAIVTETFIDAEGNSSVTSLVYPDIDEGKSAFYDKARYVPIFKDTGYKAVSIVDMSQQQILPPVIRVNE